MSSLPVSFDIQRKEIRIDFPTPLHAACYHGRIHQTGINYRDNNKVYFKLPRSVQKMEASATYGGFIIHFADDKVATRWVDVIWRQVPGSSRQLYIKRNWNSEELNQALRFRGDPVVVTVPARAEPSQVSGKGVLRALGLK